MLSPYFAARLVAPYQSFFTPMLDCTPDSITAAVDLARKSGFPLSTFRENMKKFFEDRSQTSWTTWEDFEKLLRTDPGITVGGIAETYNETSPALSSSFLHLVHYDSSTIATKIISATAKSATASSSFSSHLHSNAKSPPSSRLPLASQPVPMKPRKSSLRVKLQSEMRHSKAYRRLVFELLEDINRNIGCLEYADLGRLKASTACLKGASESLNTIMLANRITPTVHPKLVIDLYAEELLDELVDAIPLVGEEDFSIETFLAPDWTASPEDAGDYEEDDLSEYAGGEPETQIQQQN